MFKLVTKCIISYSIKTQYKNYIKFYFPKFVRVKTSLNMFYLYNLNIYV